MNQDVTIAVFNFFPSSTVVNIWINYFSYLSFISCPSMLLQVQALLLGITMLHGSFLLAPLIVLLLW